MVTTETEKRRWKQNLSRRRRQGARRVFTAVDMMTAYDAAYITLITASVSKHVRARVEVKYRLGQKTNQTLCLHHQEAG